MASLPIVEGGRLIGLVTATDLARVPPQDAEVTHARQIMSRRVVRAYPDESLYDAWLRMTQRGLRQLAVVDRGDARRVEGIVTLKAIGRLLRQPMSATASPPGISGSSTRIPVPAEWGVAALAGESRGDQRRGEAEGAPRPPTGSGHGPAVAIPGPESPPGHPAPGHPLATIEDADTGVEQGEGVEQAGEGDEPMPAVHPQPPDSSPRETEAWRRAAQSRVGQDPLAAITVAEAMLRTPRLMLETEPLEGVLARLDERGRALMVVNAGGDLVGLVTRSDLRGRSPVENGRKLTAGDVAVRRLVTARPEETLRAASQRMSRLGLRQLPVVPEGALRPVGLLRRSDVLEAYAQAVSGAGSPSPELQ